MLKIGMIGLDSSRSVAFAELLNREGHPYHVPGGRITAAYPGGSPDFPFAASRVKGYAEDMEKSYGVRILDTLEEVVEASDAVLLGSADGRVHLEQFARIAPWGKPVFIDKPLCLSYADALRIAELAHRYGVSLMSCSSLRYSEGLEAALEEPEYAGGIAGAYVFGPMEMEETQAGYFWYGVHTAEMLYRILGTGCRQVAADARDDCDVITGIWDGGRIGIIRGDRKGWKGYGAVLHHAQGPRFVDVKKDAKPFYAGQLEKVMELFRTGRADVPLGHTLEIVRFLEAANESAARGGQPVML